ncbi:MAG: SH3 domain-containing protein, partial [Bacillota bacterium]
QTVEKLGVSGNWTKISYNGKTAYVSTQYLKDVLPSETASASYVQATANVNVRSGPGTSYSKLGQLTKGQTVQKLGTSGSWTKISYNGKTAYVSSQYLKAIGSSSSGSTTAATYVEATANVNVRSGPGTSYSKLGQLYKGTIVPKLGTSGSWTKIIYNSQTAYVSSQYLKSSSYTGDAGSTSSGGTSTSTGGTFNDAAAAELISIINGYRQNAGIAKLTTTAALNKAAKIRVQEIVKQFSHTRPDGTTCFTVDPDNVQGENIAKGSGLPTAQSAADGFMNSTRHRENAMRTTFTKTGAACLKVGATTYWVHLFGY